jgi:HAD superfamily hydrolase (TIGR01509 family)
MASKFDLIIFDCDGILVDSEGLANKVFVDMLAELGYELDEEWSMREFFGVTLQERIDATAKMLEWKPEKNFLSDFVKRITDVSEVHLKPIPGVKELVEKLPTPKCVASNALRNEIIQRVRIAGLTEHFGNSIFSGLEVPAPKPAPDVFLAAAKAFDVHPSKCAVIEDSILGVTAGVRAGMTVFGYATFVSEEDMRSAGAIPFKSMGMLQEILVKQ